LQPAEISWLRRIAESHSAIAANAKAILDFVFGTTRYQGTTVLNEEKSRIYQPEGSEAIPTLSSTVTFEVTPNPAVSFVEIMYFYGDDQDATVQVYDMAGKLYLNQALLVIQVKWY